MHGSGRHSPPCTLAIARERGDRQPGLGLQVAPRAPGTISEGLPRMLFILRLWEAQRGGVPKISRCSPVTVGPGLELSDLFPPVSQGPTVWANVGKKLGIAQNRWPEPHKLSPSRPQAPEQAFLSLCVAGGLEGPCEHPGRDRGKAWNCCAFWEGVRHKQILKLH